MARIHELLRQLRPKNAALLDDVEREVAALAPRSAFGLKFERHTPEAVELPGRPVRAGDKVHVLPPHGKTPKTLNSKLWRAVSIQSEGDDRTAVQSVELSSPSSTVVADASSRFRQTERTIPVFIFTQSDSRERQVATGGYPERVRKYCRPRH